MKRIAMGGLALLLLFGVVQGALAQGIPAAFLLYPNYRGLIFSDRPEILVEAPSGATVAVRDGVSGATVATATSSVVATPVRIAAGTLTTDRAYRVTVSQGSTTLATWDVTPVPASRRSTMNISFDPLGRLLVRGQRTFVLGLYDNGHPYTTDPNVYEQRLFAPGGNRQLEGINFNFYLNYHYGEATLGPMQTLMDVLQRHNVMYLQTANCFNDGSYTRIPFSVDENDAYPTQFGQHRGSAGYYIMDECDDPLIPETKKHHRRLAGLDPDSMTFGVSFANGFSTLDDRKWVEAVDVLGTDPYPLYGPERTNGYSHFQVADTIAMLNNAQRYTRPTVGVLQFFKFTSDSRWPTYEEKRAHAIMAIVEGAQGLFWWEIGNNGLGRADAATRTEQMAHLRSIINELAALQPVLTAPDAPAALTGNSTRYADPIAGRLQQLELSITNSWLWVAQNWYRAERTRLQSGDASLSPLARNTADIRTKVKIVGGRGYVFAYNYTNRTLPVTFTWHQSPGTVTENQTNRNVTVSGSSWTDSFGPYQSRIYVIGNGGTAPDGSEPPAPPPAPPPPSGVTVAFSSPSAGETVSGTETVSYAANGGSGSGYSYRVTLQNGTQLYSGPSGSFGWNTVTATNGSHTVTVTATDSGGRTGTASRTVTVSNITPPPPAPAPVAAFVSPAAGASLSNTVAVNMSSTGGATGARVFRLEQVVGTTATLLSSQSVTGTTASYSYNTTTRPNGTVTLRLTVTDSAGRASEPVSRAVTITNGAAFAVSFSYPTRDGTTSTGDLSVGASTSAPWGRSKTWTLTVDGTTLMTVTNTAVVNWYTLDTRKLENGLRTVRLSVTYNGSTASTTRTINVSNTPPEPFAVAFAHPLAGATVARDSTVGASTTAPWGQPKTWTVWLDDRLLTSVTNTGTVLWFRYNTRTVSDGAHTLRIRVTWNGQTAVATRAITINN